MDASVSPQVQQQQPQPPQPVLIPIHTDSEIPEWAMLEVNGELIFPKESPEGKENPTEAGLVQRHEMELGTVDYVDNVRCCCGWVRM